MDNYISNLQHIPLYLLRQLQIGACGTVHVNSAGFPKRPKAPKAKKVAWNTLSGIVVDQAVFALVWIDIAPATKLSTIYKSLEPALSSSAYDGGA
jgi:hypothetical protein